MSEFYDHHVPKILIVDDSFSDILVMQKSLAGLGDIYNAASGNHAMQQLALLKPEIVLLDIEMPDVNGLEICQSIRDNPELSATRVIFATAHEDDHTEYLSFKSGADDYLVKPYNMNICRFRVQNQIRIFHLSRRSQLLLAILDGLPGALSVWTDEGRCLCANEQFYHQFQLKPSLRYSLTLAELVGSQLEQELRQGMESGKSRQMHYQGQAPEPIRLITGTSRWQPITDSEKVMLLRIDELDYRAA